LANAFIFHAELAEVDPRVRPLRPLLEEPDLRSALRDHWQFIQSDINYVPIFSIAQEVLVQLPERRETDAALRQLAEAVLSIVAERAALRHDLMGRIYHTLLLDAKYLGTYYTSVPAATLLLSLALDSERWSVDWSSLEQIRQFRVGDLACGTGTLLMAAQQAITDNFVRATVAAGEKASSERLRELHQALMEQVLHGYDVLASAVHLTASTLALLAPDIAFKKMNLFCLPLEAPNQETVRLGSIDYALRPNLMVELDLMHEVRHAGMVTGTGDEASAAPLPKLDLCVMNPPFTRSVGGNLLFGSLPQNQRRTMQRELASLLRGRGRHPTPLQASSTAGLGSVFVAVADRYLKDDGRMAVVLPEALAFGVAWEKTRQLFAARYVVEVIVVSHDPERWNFSESTSLSEILVVARRAPNREEVDKGVTVCVNLWQNSTSPIDALALASAIRGTEPADIESGHGVASVIVGRAARGELVRIPWAALKHDQWYICAFAQTDLVRTAHFLRKGKLYISPAGPVAELPLTFLSSLGDLGPDRRDIHDGFSTSPAPSSYPAFWGHDAEHVVSLSMEPNAYLRPLSRAKRNRSLRRVDLLWPRAGRIMLAGRMWFNTQRLLAVRLPETALSNVWWPFRLREDDEYFEKALVLWLNSTLGIIMVMSHRVPTRGAWVEFKKPVYEMMPVLDLWSLSQDQIMRLADTFDAVADEGLLPLPQMAHDPVRVAIDRSISEILELPSLDRLRQALAREPVISLQSLSRSRAEGR
jgi:hypothetical protein